MGQGFPVCGGGHHRRGFERRVCFPLAIVLRRKNLSGGFLAAHLRTVLSHSNARSFALLSSPLSVSVYLSLSRTLFRLRACTCTTLQFERHQASHAYPTCPIYAPPPPRLSRLLYQGSELEGQECAVCKDDFAVGDKARELPCRHSFHEQW